MLTNSDLAYYIGKDALLITKKYPDYKVKYYFPKQIISRENRRDRINVVVVKDLVHRIWLG